MPGAAPDIWALVIETVVPAPSVGVTGFGVNVSGFGAPSIVPRTSGLAGSPASVTVDSATVPLNAWLRLTRNEPTLAVVPVVPTLTVAGLVIEKSGISWVTPE